jgi:hypothetical protein
MFLPLKWRLTGDSFSMAEPIPSQLLPRCPCLHLIHNRTLLHSLTEEHQSNATRELGHSQELASFWVLHWISSRLGVDSFQELTYPFTAVALVAKKER